MKILSYADAYTPYALQLDSGRTIRLDQLIQSRTYAGLLLGAPDEHTFEMQIDGAITKAKRILGDDPLPHLIAPEPVFYTVELGRSRINRDLVVTPDDGEIRRHRGQRLPLVTCIAQFTSREPAGKPEDAGIFSESVATLVWFQEAFGVPTDEAILDRLQQIRWEAIATDMSW